MCFSCVSYVLRYERFKGVVCKTNRFLSVSQLHQTFCDPRVAVFGELGMRLEGHRLLPMAPLSSVSKILQVR